MTPKVNKEGIEKNRAPEPLYLSALRKGTLAERKATALQKLSDCDLCPRKCHVNRTEGEQGYCRTGRRAVVASYSPHYGEEAPLAGTSGSGTIFFAHCNLLCNFCQNFDISHEGYGIEVSSSRLARMMLELQERGCHNINFVTPSHVIPQMLAAIEAAAGSGLKIPVIYNSGGYDDVGSLQLLEGIIDIYMPDFKFWDPEISHATMNASDYPEVARNALIEMHRQVGDLVLENGIAVRGLLVRHLVMPSRVAGTGEIMRFIAEQISKETYVNIMAQYRPCGRSFETPEINRALSTSGYLEALATARQAALHRLD